MDSGTGFGDGLPPGVHGVGGGIVVGTTTTTILVVIVGGVSWVNVSRRGGGGGRGSPRAVVEVHGLLGDLVADRTDLHLCGKEVGLGGGLKLCVFRVDFCGNKNDSRYLRKRNFGAATIMEYWRLGRGSDEMTKV